MVIQNWDFLGFVNYYIIPDWDLNGFILNVGKLLSQLFPSLGKLLGVSNLVFPNWNFLGCANYYIIPDWDWDLYG